MAARLRSDSPRRRAGTQAKLLTLFDQQALLPLGAGTFQPMHLDAQFISATNGPLHRAAEDGTFRADRIWRACSASIPKRCVRD